MSLDRSYMRKYDIGAAPWNALSKSDFLTVAARLSAEVAADSDGLPPRVVVSVSWADSDAEMTLDEFTRNFSASSAYRYLTIKVYSPRLSIYSRFGAPRADHSFLLSSSVLTDAELEDAADALEPFFVALFRKYEPEPSLLESSQEVSGGQAPVRSEHLMPSRENDASNDKNSDEDKPEQTHSEESTGNQNKRSLLRKVVLTLAELAGRFVRGLFSGL